MANGIAWARMAPDLPRTGSALPLGKAPDSRASSGGPGFAALVDAPEKVPARPPVGDRTEPEDASAPEPEETRPRDEEDRRDADETGPGLPPPDPRLMPEVRGSAADSCGDFEGEVPGPGSDVLPAPAWPPIDDRQSADPDQAAVSTSWASGVEAPSEEQPILPDYPSLGVGEGGEGLSQDPETGAAGLSRTLPGSVSTAARPAGDRSWSPLGAQVPSEALDRQAIQSDAAGITAAGGTRAGEAAGDGRAAVAFNAAAASLAAQGHSALRGEAVRPARGTMPSVGGLPASDEPASGATALPGEASGVAGPVATEAGGRASDPRAPAREMTAQMPERPREVRDADSPARPRDESAPAPASNVSGRVKTAGPGIAASLRGRDILRDASGAREFEASVVLPSSPGASGPSLLATAEPQAEAHRIARQVAAHPVLKAGGSAEMSLAPEELGHLRLSVEASDSGLRIVIEAARPETAVLMRRHEETLRQELEQEDLGTVNVSIEDGDGRHSVGSAPECGPGGVWHAEMP